KTNINKWLKDNSYYDVLNKGNPWIDFILKHDNSIINEKRDIILYTLQQEYLDDYILDAIKQTPTQFIWWIRLHPRMTQAKKQIENQLLERDIQQKVEIEKATLIPLPIILKNSKI